MGIWHLAISFFSWEVGPRRSLARESRHGEAKVTIANMPIPKRMVDNWREPVSCLLASARDLLRGISLESGPLFRNTADKRKGSDRHVLHRACAAPLLFHSCFLSGGLCLSGDGSSVGHTLHGSGPACSTTTVILRAQAVVWRIAAPWSLLDRCVHKEQVSLPISVRRPRRGQGAFV